MNRQRRELLEDNRPSPMTNRPQQDHKAGPAWIRVPSHAVGRPGPGRRRPWWSTSAARAGPNIPHRRGISPNVRTAWAPWLALRAVDRGLLPTTAGWPPVSGRARLRRRKGPEHGELGETSRLSRRLGRAAGVGVATPRRAYLSGPVAAPVGADRSGEGRRM